MESIYNLMFRFINFDKVINKTFIILLYYMFTNEHTTFQSGLPYFL